MPGLSFCLSDHQSPEHRECCASEVLYFLLHYLKGTWAAVEHLSTVLLSFIYTNDPLKPTANQYREAWSFFLALMVILQSSRSILWTCLPCKSQCEISDYATGLEALIVVKFFLSHLLALWCYLISLNLYRVMCKMGTMSILQVSKDFHKVVEIKYHMKVPGTVMPRKLVYFLPISLWWNRLTTSLHETVNSMRAVLYLPRRLCQPTWVLGPCFA